MKGAWDLKLEYTGSFFRISIEFYRLRPVLAKYQVTPRRQSEECRQRLLRKLLRQIRETEA